MGINNSNRSGLVERVKSKLILTFDKVRSSKLLVRRLYASVTNQTNDKLKILKNKYRACFNRESKATKKLFPAILVSKTNKVKEIKEKYKHSRKRSNKQALEETGTVSIFGNLSKRLRIQKLSNHVLKVPIDKIKKIRLYDYFQNNYFHKLKITNGLNIKKVLAIAVVLIFSLALFRLNSTVDAFAIEVDGKKLAIVTEYDPAKELVSKMKTQKAQTWNRKVDIQQKLSFRPVKAKRYQINDFEEIKQSLEDNLTFVAVATGIKVNGQVAAVVSDEKTAQKVLDKIKNSSIIEEMKNVKVDFKEEIELVDVPVSLNNVLTEEKAVELLKNGKEKKTVHVVKEGDSLWSIARHYDMHVADLRKYNPSIKGEHLDLGHEINLVALEPMVNVVVTGELTRKETVPYKVVVERDSSMWRGREKVKVSGTNGLREVTYKVVMNNGNIVKKDVLNEKVLKTPQNKVVVRGSKYVVASRGKGGILGWPLNGRITSGYGMRWGRMHTGVDIDGRTGQPIGAAADGVVTATGWEGAYGKMVTVKHDNGLVTRYAHLSKIEVSRGQKVKRGDLIGLCGSTGRSTGSHLHFEVLSKGRFQNPMNYLK